MKILAIETSCDDTGIAILEIPNPKSQIPKFEVLASIVSSQIKIHKKYGGVYPALAKREHQRNLAPVLMHALKQAKLRNSEFGIRNSKKNTNSKIQTLNHILERENELAKKLIPFLKKYAKPKIDLIAVTNGPGLEPCLWVGVNFTKAISYFWDIPAVAVNHIESHILINFLSTKLGLVDFPAICLVVSGGHTQLILMKKIGDYKILGETRDDAAGECFDKCAKILGLGYPGGPMISKLAADAGHLYRYPASAEKPIKLPRPMINSKDYDFSFSGLKTAVLYEVQRKNGSAPLRSTFNRTSEGRQYIKQMCVEIQQAIIDVLIKKTLKAAKDFKVKSIILGGGVTANKELRKQFSQNLQTSDVCKFCKLLVPPASLSTDNALMTAVAGYFKVKQNKFSNWQDIEANANLRVE